MASLLSHRAVAWPWIPFERYLNPAIIESRLSTGSGVLADGPDRLLREYAAVLREAIEPYFPYPPRPSHRWDEDSRCWVDEDANLQVLILGGSSYIVGSDFFGIGWSNVRERSPWALMDSIGSITTPIGVRARRRSRWLAATIRPCWRRCGSLAIAVGSADLGRPRSAIRELAATSEVDLDDFIIHHAEGDAIAAAAVALVRAGEAQALMKGQIATPTLMKAVLHHNSGLEPVGLSARSF